MIFHCRKGRAVPLNAKLTLREYCKIFQKIQVLRTHNFYRPVVLKIPLYFLLRSLSQHSLILQRKNQTRPGAQLKTSKNFKIMTYVSNIFSSSLNSNRKLKYFSVEVITFDGESYIEEIEARSADEAQEIAASRFDNVDYTMVQGCFAGF